MLNTISSHKIKGSFENKTQNAEKTNLSSLLSESKFNPELSHEESSKKHSTSDTSNTSNSTEEHKGTIISEEEINKNNSLNPSPRSKKSNEDLLNNKRKRNEKKNPKKTKTAKKEQKNPPQQLTHFQKQMLLSYPTESYEKDMKKIEDSNKPSLNLMKRHFPSMFSHTNYYTYTKLLNERREHREIFIDNKSFTQNKKNFFLLDETYCKANESPLPKKIWSMPTDREIDYEDFYNKCIQVWPFNECCFVKEFALEFLMMNNYDINSCLEKLKQFVLFAQMKTKENNIPIVRTDAKIIKNYSLRMHKK